LESTATHILLVDDDEEDLLIARELLAEIAGRTYELDWATDFDGAIEAAAAREYDVFLIDYTLGDRTGLDLLRDFIHSGYSTPTILLTGVSDMNVDLDAMRAGAADYLIKGQIDADMLERSIRYAVERSRTMKEQERLEQQLVQAQRMEAVGQLAGGIAHDFNNLLTAIIGYAELGAKSVEGVARVENYFEEIQKSGNRAASLTRQLLVFSRQDVVDQQPTNLNDLILNTHSMLHRTIGPDIEIETMGEMDLGIVDVDTNQVEQVLVSLAINSRDAMPNGGKIIFETSNVWLDDTYVARHPDVAQGEHVMLAVSDNGMGMTVEVQERIFEPFFTTKEPGKGTGLGLSTCYGVVKQNGGHITSYSEPGIGTTFRMYFPRVDDPVDSSEHARYMDVTSEGNERVLLVDDESSIREMAATVLRDYGYTVLEAENGSEALRVIHNADDGKIDLLLTDVIMPKMGGEELAEKVTEIDRGTKVLYTSGFTNGFLNNDPDSDRRRQFLSKPFTPESLARRVRNLIDS
jgi:signal transduction histidine kinase